MDKVSLELTYFQEVAKLGNLTRASERLGVTQPTLTHAIQRLEKMLGATLFYRGKRGVTLTEAGKILEREAHAIDAAWNMVQNKVRASKTEIRGIISIGVHQSVAEYALPKAIAQIHHKYPHLELQLHHDLSRKISEAVISGKIDLGIVVNPVRHPDLVIQSLANDVVTVWKKPGNASDTLIYDPNLLQCQKILKTLKPSHSLTSSSLEVVRALGAAGAGHVILPGRVAALEPKLERISGAPTVRDEIAIIYRMEKRDSLALKTVREVITKSL